MLQVYCLPREWDKASVAYMSKELELVQTEKGILYIFHIYFMITMVQNQ